MSYITKNIYQQKAQSVHKSQKTKKQKAKGEFQNCK